MYKELFKEWGEGVGERGRRKKREKRRERSEVEERERNV